MATRARVVAVKVLGYILKLEPIGFDDRLDVGSERRRGQRSLSGFQPEHLELGCLIQQLLVHLAVSILVN